MGLGMSKANGNVPAVYGVLGVRLNKKPFWLVPRLALAETSECTFRHIITPEVTKQASISDYYTFLVRALEDLGYI